MLAGNGIGQGNAGQERDWMGGMLVGNGVRWGNAGRKRDQTEGTLVENMSDYEEYRSETRLDGGTWIGNGVERGRRIR